MRRHPRRFSTAVPCRPISITAETGQWPPDSEATRRRAYRYYEEALAEKNAPGESPAGEPDRDYPARRLRPPASLAFDLGDGDGGDDGGVIAATARPSGSSQTQGMMPRPMQRATNRRSRPAIRTSSTSLPLNRTTSSSPPPGGRPAPGGCRRNGHRGSRERCNP